MGSNFGLKNLRDASRTSPEKERIPPENKPLSKLILFLFQCSPFFWQFGDMLIFGEVILQIWQVRIWPSWNFHPGRKAQYYVYAIHPMTYPLAGWQSKSNLGLQVRDFFETTSHWSRSTTIHYVDLFFIVPNNAKELIIKNAETMPFRLYLKKLTVNIWLPLVPRPEKWKIPVPSFLNTAILGRFPSSKISVQQHGAHVHGLSDILSVHSRTDP